MNMVPLDLATFGNHEFDVKIANFVYAIANANWTWLSVNVYNSTNLQSFTGVPQYTVKTYQGVRVGFIGVSSYVTLAAYMGVQNLSTTFNTLNTVISQHNSEWDFLVCISHLAMGDDQLMVEAVPGIDMVIGGHEHENWNFQRGGGKNLATLTGFQQITKADANLVTVWVHELTFNSTTKKLINLESKLKALNNDVALDPTVQARCEYWQYWAFQAYLAQGINATATVTTLPYAIDGREGTVRFSQCPLNTLGVQSMSLAFPDVQMSLLNSGSFRLDDWILPGPLTQYDILRILPYTDYVWTANVTGAALINLLNIGMQSSSTGAYLAYYNVSYWNNSWVFSGSNQPIVPTEWYYIATIDFMLKGLQTPSMTWFHDGYVSPDGTQRVVVLSNISNSSMDLRKFVIQQLQIEFGVPM